jgi:hypothetical protein
LAAPWRVNDDCLRAPIYDPCLCALGLAAICFARLT